ncbi:MAG: SCO family protein [Myxococcota bacterium]
MKLASFFITCFGLVAGEGSLLVPQILQGTEIVDKPGAKIPQDVQLLDHTGKPVRFADILGKGKPVVLTLGYYQCPMLCSLVLNGLTDVMKKQSLQIGRDYTILSVSINPNEKPDLADAKRKNYLKVIDKPDSTPWVFATGSMPEVKRLADSVGFGYQFDKKSGEYIHSAGIFVVSPQGVLTRTIYGISYKPSDFKMSLIDASNGKIGSLLDRVILSCFHYEPDSHKYGFYIFGLMRIAGFLTIVVISAVLLMFWKRERRAKAWTT